KCYPYKSYYRLNTPSFSYYFLDSAEGSHGDDQIQNLTSIMENDSKRKIICSHYPLYADTFADKLLKTTERAVLISLFAKTNVLYYLCGHTHKKQSIDFGRFKQEIVGDLHWSKEWAVLYINESTSSCSYVYY
ncbi:MAG: hypothetical protein K6E51_13210, partial [Treponema sp.]|nr:hypothetical protein [Treponema sp.]